MAVVFTSNSGRGRTAYDQMPGPLAEPDGHQNGNDLGRGFPDLLGV